MFIANELRKTNIAEYLLYMWQMEDTLRAFGLDTDRIEKEYVSRFHLSDAEAREEMEWIENLVRMMREEGCTESGRFSSICTSSCSTAPSILFIRQPITRPCLSSSNCEPRVARRRRVNWRLVSIASTG